VPISELVFGTLTENRSSLEPCSWICGHYPACRIVDHAKRGSGLTVSCPVLNEVPRDFGCTSWASGAGLLGRLTAFLMSKPGAYLKLDGNGAWWCDPQDYSGFGLKPQTPTPKSAQLASRAPARAGRGGFKGVSERLRPQASRASAARRA
jgi:hypothetical protein